MTATRDRIERIAPKLLEASYLPEPSSAIAEIEKLLTALWEEVQPKWQSIESAPRNKTVIALLHVGKGFYRYGTGWYMPMEGWQGWDFMSGGEYVSPTHWMPLPLPNQPSETL